MEKRVHLFLNGNYDKTAYAFYQKIFEYSANTLWAVDGGANFLVECGVRPAFLVGDFDSILPANLKKLHDVPQQRFAEQKDATDTELTIDLAYRNGFNEIVLVGGCGETDHELGNLFQLQSKDPHVWMCDPYQDVFRITNSEVKLGGEIGKKLSIIPISSEVKLSGKGLLYPLEGEVVFQNSTRTLRNEFSEQRVSCSAEGDAWVIVGRNP